MSGKVPRCKHKNCYVSRTDNSQTNNRQTDKTNIQKDRQTGKQMTQLVNCLLWFGQVWGKQHQK